MAFSQVDVAGLLLCLYDTCNIPTDLIVIQDSINGRLSVVLRR